MQKETILVNGQEYAVNVHLERRNDARVSIGRSGVNIRIPLGMPREAIFKNIQEMKAWAKKKLEEKPLIIKKKGSKEYNDGDNLIVGKDEYLLKINYADKKSSSVIMNGNEINFNLSANLSKEKQNKHISVLLSRIVASKKKKLITSKVHNLNKEHFNFSVNKVFLKYNQSNWGSCSTKNNINISTRLLFAPDDVIDYVIIHELAHLRERNHSVDFWELVKRAVPDYKEKIKWLKNNSDVCWF
ncbi:MAG: SprT family zinc-dependent metalloprotease [Candidatus Woesearchaeota archaeon]